MFEALEQRRLFSADFNGDGVVDTKDYVILAANFGQNDSKTFSQGDTNGDHTVDTADFTALVIDFGKSLPPIAGNWRQIFNDNFNNFNQGYVQDMWGVDNDGFGAHWNNATNLNVSNGILTLTATNVPAGGKNFTSAQIQSGGNLAVGGSTPPLFSFKYGYIEARIQVPTSQGLWPTFWMMPTPNPDFHDGDGELDIIDNGSGDPSSVTIGVGKHGTHFGGDNKAIIGSGFHTVGVDWEPDHIDFYLDGKVFAHDTDLSTIPTVEMYFILGLQVDDGGWAAPPTVLPDSFKIDYVRAWSL